MKFSCEKALLLGAVSTASRAVAVKSSIPALEGILIEAGEMQREPQLHLLPSQKYSDNDLRHPVLQDGRYI